MKKIFITLAAMATIVACNSLPEQLPGSERATLSIKVEAQTKALITESVLPDASEIGVFFSEPDKTSYDESTYENIKFTAAGANAAQTWTPETDILLSGTKGTLYGYYPYSAEVSDISAIPVDVTTQIDYMWATPVENLSNETPAATLQMQHALTAVRFNIKNKNYSGTGNIKAVTMKSASLASNATLDATDGALSNVTGANTAIVSDFEPFMISTDGTKVDIIAVPVLSSVGAVNIELTIDDQVFVTTVADQEFTSGEITEYILMVGNTEFKVDGVEVSPWVIGNTTELGITQTKESLLAATYNVTDVSSSTSLYNLPEVETKASESELISKMFVDGVEVTPSAEFQFESTGSHVVEFEFIDSDVIPADFFKRNNNLMSIVIPKTYKEISDSTFKFCQELLSINIPSSIISIGASAFEGCNKINAFETPITAENIGENAFASCTGITQIVIPEGKTWIKAGEFSRCTNLQSIIIPESVTTIDQWAFSGCTNLKEVKLPSNLQYIGENAFGGTALTSIEIPKSVVHIGIDAFNTNGPIESIEITLSTSVVGKADQYSLYPFHDNVVLNLTDELEVTSITKEYIRAIPDYDLYGSFILPETVISIEDEAFEGCSYLKSIRIPDSVKKIGKKAFYNCTNLTEITLPADLTEIQDYAFSKCGEIKNDLVIPESITIIDTGVFAGTQLGKVILSSQTTKIQYEAFKECGVIDMNLPESVVEIEDDAIYKAEFNNKTNLPENIEKIGKRAFYKSTAQSITLPAKLKELGPNAFYGCSNLQSITIPDGITTIASGTFSECTSLSTVKFPANLLKIEYGAFYNCNSLTDVEFPETLIEIEGEAFRKCASLMDLAFPSDVARIGMQAFSECTSVKSLVLPENLKWLGGLCFYNNTALTKVTLPAVTTSDYHWFNESIVTGFFDGCKISEITNLSLYNKIGDSADAGSIIANSIDQIGVNNVTETVVIHTVYGDYIWPTDL